MSFANLSSAQLRQLIGLIHKKESLQAKLDKVDLALQEIEVNGAGPKKRGRKPKMGGVAAKLGRKIRRGKRGKRLKEPLLAALKAAGASGIKVKDLAAKLKVKPGNVFSWFYTTGKKVKGIKKVGEAKYALTE